MRLRLDQRDNIERRLTAMLVVPRPDFLATARERIIGERIDLLEKKLSEDGTVIPDAAPARIERLRGVLHWNIYTEYDRRFTDASQHLRDLDSEIQMLKSRYDAFVRTRQAATQSYKGYDEVISRQRLLIEKARKKMDELITRQGNMLETMAVTELTARLERLTDFQIKARFAMADSYDRAIRTQGQEKGE
jgi:hypothetical protein